MDKMPQVNPCKRRVEKLAEYVLFRIGELFPGLKPLFTFSEKDGKKTFTSKIQSAQEREVITFSFSRTENGMEMIFTCPLHGTRKIEISKGSRLYSKALSTFDLLILCEKERVVPA